MVIAADILDFFYVFLPVVLLTHLALRVGMSYGRSRGGIALFAGSSITVFSFLFRIYFDSVFGNVDTFWLFLLSFATTVGLALALFGTLRVHSAFRSNRSEDGGSGIRIAVATAMIFLVALVPFLFTMGRPVFWIMGAICYAINQTLLFGMTVLIGELFFLADRGAVPRRSKLIKVLAAYYLVEPVVWLIAIRSIDDVSKYLPARLTINLTGMVVSLLVGLRVLYFIRHNLPSVLRQVKTTYVDTLRVKVLRDFYLISTGLVIFIFAILLGAESLYRNLRISTLESYAQLRLSADKLIAAKLRGDIQDILLRLEHSEAVANPTMELIDFEKRHDYIDAVGYATPPNGIEFLHGSRKTISDTTILKTLNGIVGRNEGNGIGITSERNGHAFRLILAAKPRNNEAEGKYAFALVNVRGIVQSNETELEGHSAHLRLLSPDLKVLYSSYENEIGENVQRAVLARNIIDSKDLNRRLGLLSQTDFEGYSILKGQDKAGIGEYFVLIMTPVEFNGYKGVLTSLESEDKISSLIRPANSLLFLVGLLVVGLFGGGFIIISVTFKWSMTLEKEVQNKIRELRSSEDKYRRIVENPYIGSFIMVEGRFIYSNDRLAELLETDVDSLSGTDLSMIIDKKDHELLRNVFESIVNGEKNGDTWRVSGTTASGRQIILSGYSSAIHLGNKRGVQSLVVDSTIEHREKEKLEQFERLESMATLAAGIAHDFNNILQVVLGSSQLLQQGLAESELKKYADNITNVAKRGSDLSKRLLTFSRHRGLEEKRVFDINAIIVESLPLFEETFPRTIRIETQLSEQPIRVSGDQSQIQQVIFNLAVNARDAMPHGGTLTLRTEIREVSDIEAEVYQASPGTYAFVMVKDNGEGIPPELMSKVFEPFFTTKPPGKGTGLGLSVVYGIIRSHDGFLKAYSEVKKGTVFSIFLPLSSAVDETVEETIPKPVGAEEYEPSDCRKILFVDDEAGIREAAQFLLQQAGYSVSTAKDGIGAIQIYSKEWHDISLVVLDLNMPELSGKEVLENLTIINPDVRVLISTGYITQEERAGLKGVVEVIEKPFDFDQLLEKVRVVLETPPYKEIWGSGDSPTQG
ncbi:MAG: ATP-binding protein [Bacteroidetes bacterium]|nr:ATP-binding protein [Bacteroidota bacterium]MCL5267938.1 ATP-binding protein [Bacteroidota bacterium]